MFREKSELKVHGGGGKIEKYGEKRLTLKDFKIHIETDYSIFLKYIKSNLNGVTI